MNKIYSILTLFVFLFSNSFSQEIELTSDSTTISAGAEYSIYLQNLINSGLDAGLKFNGSVPAYTNPTGIEAITTIEGINFDEDALNGGFYHIPPDPNGATGPTHLVSVTNTSIEWFTKTGVMESSIRLGKNGTTHIGSFFQSLTPLTGTFDPKVIYDQYNGRFVVVALERTTSPSNTSRILVAVSKTTDPNGGWWFTSINSAITISSLLSFADYPGLAVGSSEIYITNNMFSFSPGSFTGARLWIVAKETFYSGGTASVNVYDPYTSTGASATTYQPTHMFGALPTNVGTFLIAYSGLTDGFNEFINIIRVDNPLSTPTFNFQQKSLGNIDSTTVVTFLNAPQLGTSALISTNDRRSLNSVWRNNSLWMTACVVPPSGTDAGQVTAHWCKVNTTTLASLVISDQGNIGGEDIATGCYTFFPSIAVNSVGDAIIGFSASAPTIYPGAYYAGRYSTTPAGTVLASQVFKLGLDYYYRAFGGARNRWGDYSGASVDPSDDLTFYIFNQYALTRGTILAGEDGRWGTAFGVVPTSELPVELSSFSASIIGSSVKLNWRTETEVNNYGFEVERKVGSPQSTVGNYEKICFVNGNGNSNSSKNYSFVDDKITAGKYSYRLKQIDNDGQFEYSKVIEVDLGAPKKFELSQNYPNPFNPITTIRFNLPEAGNVKLTLFNVLGQELKTFVNEFKESGVHTINFDASELNSGMYIYELESGSFVQTRKMTLVK